MMLSHKQPLYHGSYCIVKVPNLEMCHAGRDFGRGFYLTTDLDQAKRFVRNSIRKQFRDDMETQQTTGFVSVFEYKPDESLQIHEFETANIDWLHCIASHRRKNMLINSVTSWESYDIIYGKIANDTTNFVLTNYLNGAYGEVGSVMATALAIRFL